MGLRFEFRPEITNEGTQEEKERAGGYSALVASLVKPSAAAQMLGYELPPDYDNYEQLDEDYFEMLRMKSEIQARASLAPKEPTIAEPKPPRDKVPPDTAEADKAVRAFSVAEYAEAKNWRDISHRKLKRGDSLQFPFTAKELDESVAASIRQKLPECKTEQDIEDCFDLNNYVGGATKSELLVVADALNKAVDLITKENA
jgi:hypothetical protein